jgi:hypothetical protein
MNIERMKDILGIPFGRKSESPLKLMAELNRIAAENDDPALREAVLGPGGGLYRVASGRSGISRGSAGMESLTSSNTGAELHVGQGSTAVETPELRDYRNTHVEPYTQAVREFRAAANEIDDIQRSRRLEWSQKTVETQLVELSLRDPEGDFVRFLNAWRRANNDEDRRQIIAEAQAWQHELEAYRQQQRGEIPFGGNGIDDGLMLVGEDASTLNARVAVLEQVMKDTYGRMRELAAAAPHNRPQPVTQLFSYQPKNIGGRRSTRSFEVVDNRTKRVVATVAGEKNAAQRTHALNASQGRGPYGESPQGTEALSARDLPSVAPEGERTAAGDQTVMPGTPAKQAPPLTLSTQDVSEADARAARGPAGEQTSILDAMKPPTREEEIAKASADFNAAAAPTPTGRGAEVIDGKVVINGKVHNDLTAATWPEKVYAKDPARAAQIRADWANKKIDAGTFDFRDDVNVKPGEKRVPADAQVVKPGEKVMPEAPIAQPPNEPPKPPRKTAQGQPERPSPDEEGPNTLVTRVIDQPNGTFTLGTYDLENGLVMTGERFNDRESALLTAEQRNAEEDAITATGDALASLHDVLEGIPAQPALMSPGQAEATRRALKAERDAANKAELLRRTRYLREAEKRGQQIDQRADKETMRLARLRAQRLEEGLAVEGVQPGRHLALPAPSGQPLTRTVEEQADIDKMFKAVREARETLRKKLADDPGYGLVNPGQPPVNVQRVGKTPIAVTNTTIPQVSAPARHSLGLLEQLTNATANKSRSQVVRGAAKIALPVAQTVSRLILTGFDAGSIGRQMAILGARSVLSSGRRSVFPEAAKMVIEAYLHPDVVRDRALLAGAEATERGATLHWRGAGEYGGESVGEKVTQAAEAVPVIGEGLYRSQVSFNEALNFMGAKTYTALVDGNAKAVANGQRNMFALGPFKGIGPKVTLMTQGEKDHLSRVIDHQLGFADLRGFAEGKPRAVQALLDVASFLYAPNWQASRAAVYADFAKAIPKVLSARANVADKEAFWNGLLFASANVGLAAGLASKLGVDIEFDPRSTNFLRIPLGPPSLATSAIAAPFSALGVGVQTYNDTVYLDFTAGLGADARLIAQLFPFGGDSEDIISGKTISASGREEDPYHPKFGDRGVQGVAIDWLTSRTGPGTQITEAAIAPKGDAAQEPVLSRMGEAIVRSYIPMLFQDIAQAAGSFDQLNLEKFGEDIRNGPHWFSSPPPSSTPRPGTSLAPGATIAPTRRPGALPPPP